MFLTLIPVEVWAFVALLFLAWLAWGVGGVVGITIAMLLLRCLR